VAVFGFDGNIMPYQRAVEQSGKKLIFEGPGQDPFIVFPMPTWISLWMIW